VSIHDDDEQEEWSCNRCDEQVDFFLFLGHELNDNAMDLTSTKTVSVVEKGRCIKYILCGRKERVERNRGVFTIAVYLIVQPGTPHFLPLTLFYSIPG